MSTFLYMEMIKPIASGEKFFIKLDTLFEKSQFDTPAPTDFHTEFDDSPFLNKDFMTQSYISIL
jgi:hypothetical protein